MLFNEKDANVSKAHIPTVAILIAIQIKSAVNKPQYN